VSKETYQVSKETYQVSKETYQVSVDKAPTYALELLMSTP
jgi:hypothetical protein